MKNIISLSDLGLSFGTKVVIDRVNINIDTGQSLAILGESGGGKSVLVKMILGLIEPSRGKVLIHGIDIQEDSDAIKCFGVLFQNCALFDSLSVWENISFNFSKRFRTGKHEAKEMAIQGLKMVELSSDIADMYPVELSGGMKKRVALARAIISKPEIIVLDEPTSGLDPIMSDSISDLIVKCNKEAKFTTITITHDIHSAFKIADTVAVLYQGNILIHGSVNKIKNSDIPYVQKFIKYAV